MARRGNRLSSITDLKSGWASSLDRLQMILLFSYTVIAIVAFLVSNSDPRTNEITSGGIFVVGELLALIYATQAAYLTREKRAPHLIWRSLSFACLVGAGATGIDVILRLQSPGLSAGTSLASLPMWGLVYLGFCLLVIAFIRHRDELGLRLSASGVRLTAALLAVSVLLFTVFVTLPFLRRETLGFAVRFEGAVFMTLDVIAASLILMIGAGLKSGRETWPWKLIFAAAGLLALTSIVTENFRGRTDTSYRGSANILFLAALVLLCLSAIAQSSESWREGELSRRRSRWLAALNRLGLTVNHQMERKAVAETAVDFFSTFSGVRSVAFHSIDYRNGCLVLEASRGVAPKLLPAIARIEMTEKMHALMQTYAADHRTLDFYSHPTFVNSLEGSLKILPEIEISPWEMVKDLRSIMAFFGVLGAAGYIRIPVQTTDTLLGFVFLAGMDEADFDDDVRDMMGSAGRIISLAMNNALLYEGLAQRHAELTGAYAELARADQYKDDIISITSHELRSPLTLLQGYSDVLLSDDERITPEARERALEAIVKATFRMKKIAEDFTDVVAIRSGSLIAEVEPVEPDRLVEEIYDRLPEQSRDRVRVDAPHTDGVVLIDFDKTARAVSNLVENALKFDESGGSVEVGLSDGGRRDFRITVVDHGPGIPPHQREAVFNRFYQLDDSLHHHHEGMGMGLFIARSVVEAQGGRLSLRTTPGGGCTFIIDIPQPAAKGTVER